MRLLDTGLARVQIGFSQTRDIPLAHDDLAAVTVTDLFPRSVTDLLLHEGIPTAIRDGVWAGETRLQSEDRRSVAISQVMRSHNAEGGSVDFMASHARDITEQKHIQERRVEAEQRVSLIADSLALPCITVDAVFAEHKPVAVLHFAALIEVGESVKEPARFLTSSCAAGVAGSATWCSAPGRASPAEADRTQAVSGSASSSSNRSTSAKSQVLAIPTAGAME